MFCVVFFLKALSALAFYVMVFSVFSPNILPAISEASFLDEMSKENGNRMICP